MALILSPATAYAGMPVATDLCSVLAHPAAFMGREITLRGFVFLGDDHMTSVIETAQAAALN
jgi:hypothetical protein